MPSLSEDELLERSNYCSAFHHHGRGPDGDAYYAVPNLEARHAARMLVRHIGIFSCPSQIVSDRGTHFTAEIIHELMVLVGTN